MAFLGETPPLLTSASPSPTLATQENREDTPDSETVGLLTSGRIISLVVYGGGPVVDVHKIWINKRATFGDVVEQMASVDSTGTFVPLQAHWGPQPFWREALLDSSIEATCQVLYGVFRGSSTRYMLGVVRSPLSDYPIAIFMDAGVSPGTLLQAINHSDRGLIAQISSITDFFGDQDVRHDQLDYRELEMNNPLTFPSAVIITVGEATDEFMSDLPYRPIPTLIQIPLLYCNELLQRAYDLRSFALQMIYLSSAIRHLILSLGNEMRNVYEKKPPDIEAALQAGGNMADLLRLAPVLSRGLQGLLDSVNSVMERLESGDFLQTEVQSAIQEGFLRTCGDYPGAVTVRHSFEHFKKLVRIDRDEQIQDDYTPKGHKAQHSRNSSLIAEMSPASEVSAHMGLTLEPEPEQPLQQPHHPQPAELRLGRVDVEEARAHTLGATEREGLTTEKLGVRRIMSNIAPSSTHSAPYNNNVHQQAFRASIITPRLPVETSKIVKVQDSKISTWKMLNQYRVMHLLGRGTHGIVKYGEDMSKDEPTPVAIKIIKRMPNRKRLTRADGRDHTNSVLGRIKFEVAVMKHCHHDHIVSLIEVIDDPRSHSVFLVMEYLEGGEIKWRGPDKPLLTLEQIRRIVRDVLLGLEYLHYMGIIHRDIKPANMLWTKGRARVKLTDFGVAHFSKPLRQKYEDTPEDSPYLDNDDRLNKTEGTPAFYAPEQACNQNGLQSPTFPPGKRPPGVKGNQLYPMTKALDIWAFGVSIYCFLFGHPPFWGSHVFALCNEILETEYKLPELATSDSLPVTSNNPDLQEALRLMKGMMTKPVYARMTLAQAKVSPWVTGDLEDPAAWLRETDPEAKEPVITQDHDAEDAVAPKNHAIRVSSIMRALGIRKENSRHRRDFKLKGQNQISLEHSTHRPLPPHKPRSLYRPSADQPSSPIDPLSAVSAASSPTGTSHLHLGESYFGRSAGGGSNGKTGGLARMVSTIFRRPKKSTSAEAIMTAPVPMMPTVPKPIHDLSASSSPPNVMSMARRPLHHPEEPELDPRLITYSSEEMEDEDYEREGDVDLLGFGGFGVNESQHFTSKGQSPSEGSQPPAPNHRFDAERSTLSAGPMRRLSTITSDPFGIQRVYDPLYLQHTAAGEYRDDTITSQPASPRQETTVYIPSASTAPLPLPNERMGMARSPGRPDLALSEDSDDEDALEMVGGARRRHHDH